MRTFSMPMVLVLAALALGAGACLPEADPCPGKAECGSGCMPSGASCCPSGGGYCDGGWYCGTDNMCHASGGGGGGGGGGGTCSANTCINNLCSPGLWCCPSGHSCNHPSCGCN